jgi:hypothetical protein
MAGGGNDQLLNTGLMIAAGIAAPALAPALMSGGALGLGLSGAAATGLTGAALGGLAGAVTGQDVGKSALMGGLGGAASGDILVIRINQITRTNFRGEKIPMDFRGVITVRVK